MEFNQKLLDAVYNEFYSATPDGYLVKNYRDLFHLIDLTYSLLHPQKAMPFEEYFSEKDTINLEREFLTSLNPNYRKQFDKDYRNRRVIGKRGKTGNYYVDRKQNYYRIYYPKNFYIEDFEILTHE